MRFLPQFRGTRIRPWMRFYNAILFGGLFSVGVAGTVSYVYLNWPSVSSLDRVPLIFSGIMLGTSAGLAGYLTWFLQEATPFFKKIERLRVMARYLYSHGYYLEKQKKSRGKAGGTRTKIKFPKVYLKQGKYDLEASFEMAGSKFQEKFKNIGGELETTLFMDFMEVMDEPKFKVYKMAYSALLNRINVTDVIYDPEKGVKLMNDFYWDFTSDPHLLVAGGTGGGKTVFLRTLVRALAKIGVTDICDPKRADFVIMGDISAFEGRVSFELGEIVEQFERSTAIMYARYDFMRKEMKKLDHKDMHKFDEYGLEPYFLVCDEFNVLKSALSADYNLRDRLDDALTRFILLGRQAGCLAIIAMQKPSAEDLPTKMRANMMEHISVGRLDEYGYDAMFGESNKNKEFKYVKYVAGRRVYGRGYAGVFGEVAREFYSPLLPKNFSFFDEFEKIERHDNPFDPRENQEISSDLVNDEGLNDFIEQAKSGGLALTDDDDDRVSIAEFASRIDSKPATVRFLIGEIEKGGYKIFERVNGKHSLSIEDCLLLEGLLAQKETFDGTWKELLGLHFEMEGA